MKLFVTKAQEDTIKNISYSEGYQAGIVSGFDQGTRSVARVRKESYNEGKADGIKASKRAFALALKQKGESNNDILRPN